MPRNFRPFDSYCIFDPELQEVYDVGPSFDHDNRIGIKNIRTGRKFIFPDGADLFNPYTLPDFIESVTVD